MQPVEVPTHPLHSRIQRAIHTLSNNPIMTWGIIFLMIILILLPFLLLEKPDTRLQSLGPFLALCALPIMVAAWLHARTGSFITCLLTLVGIFLISLRVHGIAWTLRVDGATLFSIFIGFSIMGFATGQIRSGGKRLALAYHETTIAHESLAATHTELAIAYATIQKQALTDGLTGLPNHRAVMEQLHKELERASRYHRSLSLLFFDADRFKRVNDTHGHATGDAVLRQIGERVGSVLRGEDTIGRFGGEEFVILLPEANVEEARNIAERIRAAVAAGPVATAEVEGGLAATISIGLSTYPIDGECEQTLLSQADEAMYLAKRLGRNQVRTAEEARRMGEDVSLMALLHEEEQHEAAQREGVTPERLRETYTERMINSLLSLLERRDAGLSAHAHAVSDLATAIAQRRGQDPKEVSRIGIAALLHDIGKVAIPDALLQKVDQLSTQEYALLQEHAELGAQILQGSPFLEDIIPAVRHHLEQWDGSGTPDQLTQEDIPLAARIIAVAETYCFMQRTFPYHYSYSAEEALTEVKRGAGTQFDPEIVQILAEVLSSQQEHHHSIQKALSGV